MFPIFQNGNRSSLSEKNSSSDTSQSWKWPATIITLVLFFILVISFVIFKCLKETFITLSFLKQNLAPIDHVFQLKELWHEKALQFEGLNFLQLSYDVCSATCSSCLYFFSGNENTNNYRGKEKSYSGTSRKDSSNGRRLTNILIAVNVLWVLPFFTRINLYCICMMNLISLMKVVTIINFSYSIVSCHFYLLPLQPRNNNDNSSSNNHNNNNNHNNYYPYCCCCGLVL